MPDVIDSSTQTVSTLSQQDVLTPQQARRSAKDWVRLMRFNPEVNKSTIGVLTDRVTPDLLLGTSASLLRISRGEEEPSAKDSLAYQRFYGPAEYFAEHIQRDQGKLARGILWKATNKGNLDFIGSNMLEPHISSVFYDSNLAQYLDGTTPFLAVDLTFKTTRVGLGGIASTDNAPDEMRTVQPSYYGFVDPVRCYSEDTLIWTKQGWISIQDMNGDMELGCLINGRMLYHKPMAIHVYDYNGLMLSYTDHDISYCVTPNHRMYTVHMQDTKAGTKYAKDYKISDATFVQAKDIVQGRWCMFTGTGNTTQGNLDQRTFVLPTVLPTLKHAQMHGMPPQGASLKNVPELDICDFAEFMGWYLSLGNCHYNAKKSNYSVHITQDPKLNPEKYDRIRDLVMRLPFGTTPPARDKANVHSIRIHRKQLYKYCLQFGDSFNKYIPEWIFTAPLEARLRFRLAMLLGDGRAQKHLCTVSKQLAVDFARLQMDLGLSVTITKLIETRYPGHPGIYVVYWRNNTKKSVLPCRKCRNSSPRFELTLYKGKVYCPTVPGGVVYVRRCADGKRRTGVFCGNSPLRGGVGLSGYMTKNVLKGSDGKLYQRFINARTGKLELVDSVTAANSVISSHDVMEKNTRSVFAHGGKTGVRIVNRLDVDYYLPRPDDAYSTGSNMVTMLDGIKLMRLLMGCVHPMTPMITLDHQGMVHITSARNIADNKPVLYSCTPLGLDSFVICDKVLTRLTTGQKYFYKVVMSSGRVLITSPLHKWVTLGKQNKIKLLKASAVKLGMRVPRKLFVRTPVQNTDINGVPVTRDVAVLLGRIQRTMHKTDTGYRIQFLQQQRSDIKSALDKLCNVPSYFTVYKGTPCVHIKDPDLLSWILSNIGTLRETHKVPACILSADTLLVALYLDSYSKLVDNVGMDGNGDIWLMDLDNELLRTAMAFLLSRIGTDTVFRDIKTRKGTLLALKLIPALPTFGDCVVDTVVAVVKIPAPGYMIDFDADDDVYAVGHGVITHNSKYATQAVPLLLGLVPLVQSIDRYSGKTIESLVGRKLGARFALKPGVVTAVRLDRVDVVYDDGQKGSIDLYKNFPANIKGYLSNRVLVKAGDRFDKDQIIAASNFTDDNGVQAMGRNLRVGYISYKGGTYEDACVLSESAAKKLSSRTMYKTNVDLNSTIRTGKNTYTMWKPQQYKNEALLKLDDDGVVKVGQVLHKGDPMVLAVQVTEPSPGTMGKRLLTDKCLVWEHAHPGVVTDVVKTRKGIKVYATVDAPVLVGDKLSGRYGNKATAAMILPDDQMPRDSKGRPLDMLMSPLGIVSRCYDKDTLFLTRKGWKKGADVIRLDLLYAYDPNTGMGLWSKQLLPMYSYKHTGIMYCAKSKAVDFCVTKGHRVWARTLYPGSSYTLRRILDIFGKRYLIPCAAEHRDMPTTATDFLLPVIQIPHKDTHTTNLRIVYNAYDWALFLGWYLTLGNTTWCLAAGKKLYRVHIAQNDSINPDKCQRILKLLTRLGFTFNYGARNKQFHISGKRLAAYCKQFGNCALKFIPDWLFEQPLAVIDRFLLALMLGDGSVAYTHTRKDGTRSCTQRICLCSLRLIDQLQYIYALKGIHTRKQKVKKDTRYADAKPMYSLGISTIDKTLHMLRGSMWYTTDYDGYVYCPTVTTGYVLTRRNGVLSCLGNTNPSQLIETQLGKIALKLGHPIEVNQFLPLDKILMVKRLSKLHNVPMSLDVYDPDSGRTLKGILTGRQYVYKLKHMALSKMSARGTATYNALGVPAAGGLLGSKRFGGLLSIGLIGHGAFDALVTDAKLIRGQSNAEFWRKIRVGQIPTIPGLPLVHKKFFAHLQGSGMRIRKTSLGISIFALTNSDVKLIAGNRLVKTRDTYLSKSFQPMDGGLFGTDIFGMDGTRWGYIQLDEPMLNPVMEQPVARLLQIPLKKLLAILRGQLLFRGKKGPLAIADALQKVDILNLSKKALAELKAASKSKKDAALKRYVAILRMRRVGVHPSEFMLLRIPVIPPQFRPITSHNGLTMVADSNYLYAQLIDARDDMRAAQNLPDEYKDKARSMIYTKWKLLVGLYEPLDRKLKLKSVKGLLKWALGEPAKYGAFQRKVFGSIVDTVGRGVVLPNSRLKLNLVGLPLDMAWNVFSPFVTRALVQAGYSTVDALKATKSHSPVAKLYLLKAMLERPVIMNRAPSLHKLSLMGFKPKLVTGHAIHVHPSIVVPFGMDFDGDTVNIHAPVSRGAVRDIKDKMMPLRNLISMANRTILYKPLKEYIQGLYLATRTKDKPVKRFATLAEARLAYKQGTLDVDDPILIG